jgi:hypothetical protein
MTNIHINYVFAVYISIISPLVTRVSSNIWCYSCVSSQPGCGEYSVNWFIHPSVTCDREDDKCVKIIEKRDSETQITRDCLSNLIGLRKDIPADHYEGCRAAASQPKTAVYVDNHVKELDLQHKYWTNTTYCFCEFDEWCNTASKIHPGLYGFMVPCLVVALINRIIQF